MRYAELRLDEKVLKLHTGEMVIERPSKSDLMAMLEKSRFRFVRGMAFECDGKWRIAFWPADEMTHQQFFDRAAKTGYRITDDIGIFIANDRHMIEREALSGSLTVEPLGADLTMAIYPATAWSMRILREQFPRLFGQEEAMTEDATPLYEMANLYPQTTGLPVTVWASPKGYARHDLRIKVSTGKRIEADTAVVALRPEIHLVHGSLDAATLDAVTRWAALNLSALNAYWNEEIDTAEFIQHLKKV